MACAMSMAMEVDKNITSASKKLTKANASFSVQELSHLLKSSPSLRAQIFSSSNSTTLHIDEDEVIIKPIPTGYVSHAFTLQVNGKPNSNEMFFIKINMNAHAKQMFDDEVHGLHALQEESMGLLRVPRPLGTGTLSELHHDQGAWFLAEHVAMASTKKKRTNKQYYRFAQALAKMHQISAENHSRSSRLGQFGFDTNNFYIHTEQDNTWKNDWCTFYLEQRLKPVVQRMKNDPVLISDHAKNMELILLCDRLIAHVPWFLTDSGVQIPPSLLHGDLSNQNWSIDKDDNMVIFDGSPFFGPYEVDIHTMPQVFIQAYFDTIGGPTEGYEMRFELYNLVRLFRCITDTQLGMWRPQAFQCLSKLLTHCGAWTSSLIRFPCGLKTPLNKIKHPSSTNSQIEKKNVVLVYGGSFCPIHLNHLEVMNFVAETLEKPPYNFEILGGYFCPSTESWLKKKLPKSYLPKAYRESLLLLATEGTRWMVDRNYFSPNKLSDNITQAIHNLFGERCEVTIVHICGIDAIKGNETRVSTQYPLVVVDRLGYDGETVWKSYLINTTDANRERLIWISPWRGETRSSTMIRQCFSNASDTDNANLRQSLRTLLPSACIEYISEYDLGKWFK